MYVKLYSKFFTPLTTSRALWIQSTEFTDCAYVSLLLTIADPLYVSDKYANSSANSLPKLFTLLRDCLLSHRWAEVVEVMAAIAKEPGNNEGTLLKVTF